MKQVLGVILPFLFGPALLAQDADLPKQAAQGLRKAVEFFRTKVSTGGGYLWRYSADLKKREGEGPASATQVWVQPPGTPTVAQAFLDAYQATGDPYYLECAKDAGEALIQGQLHSGGWDYSIEFHPKSRLKFAYRQEPSSKAGKNVSTLDDNTTQAALRFLMNLDRVLDQKNAKVHEAVEYGLQKLLQAQYPNGAWPQRFSAPPNPAKFPVKKASYPETWPRTYPAADYKSHYTLNDNSQADVIDVFLQAARLYDQPRYREAALKGGDFFLLAQMPEPQPGWAQQYDANMHPAWARKFEPPGITGGESQRAMQTLLRLYRETGEKKYQEPLPRALAYYKKSLLPDGRLARFYELKTNKPLYFTKKYELTYDDSDLPTHYGFKVGSKLDQIEKELETVRKLDFAKPPGLTTPKKVGPPSSTQKEQVQEILTKLDAEGRWVEKGKLKYHGPDDPTDRILDCTTFVKNVGILSSYLAAAKR